MKVQELIDDLLLIDPDSEVLYLGDRSEMFAIGIKCVKHNKFGTYLCIKTDEEMKHDR